MSGTATNPPSKRVQGKKGGKQRHPWRENIEALAMAIIVALVLKAFVIEVSKIPSGSMQPTLMGNPAVGVFDRVIVDKLSFRFRDPQRHEIVVFKHPLERSRNMVKRVVGMPGEELRILQGDIWARSGPEDAWEVVRRSRAVEEEMWRPLAPLSELVSDWQVDPGSTAWRVDGDEVEAGGPGSVRFRPDAGIRNAYFDGYPATLDVKIGPIPDRADDHHVGDLRLDTNVAVEQACSEALIEIHEGQRVYSFHLPGPDAPEDARPRIVFEDRGVRRDPTTGQRIEHAPVVIEAEETWRLRAGRSTSVRAQNLDDRLELSVDGKWILALDVEGTSRQESGIALHLFDAGGELSDLAVYRDVYYLRGSLPEAGIRIAADHYFMLGDNTMDSADGREWREAHVVLEEGTRATPLLGNFRGGNDPLDTNPFPNTAPTEPRPRRFRDLHGERHFGPMRLVSADQGQHTVPRELVQGRALAVFWPIKPLDGVWRLGWIH